MMHNQLHCEGRVVAQLSSSSVMCVFPDVNTGEWHHPMPYPMSELVSTLHVSKL